ncbi:MAG: type II secretion system F family protein [Actinoplanes sp.]
MTGNGWVIIALAAGLPAAFLFAYALLDSFFGRSAIQRRIASLRVFTDRTGTPRASWPLVRSAGRWIERHPLLNRYATRSETMLDQLGSTTRPSEWLFLRGAVALATALLLAVLLPVWLGLPAGLLFGYHIPGLLLRSKIERRRQRFADELPGVLQLMLSSLRSGFTLQQSVEAAVRDDDGPVGEELGRALSETRLNGEFEDALERAGERLGSQETIWLVMAIRLQREVGGSLAEVMQTTADTMRERAYLRRHVRTLSAEGRISAYVLTALPVASGAMLFVTRPEYVRPLYTETAGLLMLALAVVMMTVGGLWLRAVTKIEV